ncbi:hypothetical protein C8Q76DRAFT_407700 [Earliella scabrosa]|nr:hypothetical protein C8Q76DRAFT_407700 [Earliella scabrosa]
MTFTKHVPFDVIECILSHARQMVDRQTFFAWATVSRAWRELCLPHLFSSLRIRTARLESFATFLTASPHIGRHVKNLVVYGPPTIASRMPWQLFVSLRVSPDSHLVRALSHLPALRTLRCQDIWFLRPEDSLPFITDQPIFPTPFKLHRLVLHRCWVPTQHRSSFASVLTAFDTDIIEVMEASFQRGLMRPMPQSDFLPRASPPLITCRSLLLRPLQDSEGHSLTVDAFRRTLLPGGLRTLTVDCWTWPHVQLVGGLLRECCSNLEELNLDVFNIMLAMREDVEHVTEWVALKLTSCPQLRSLSFVIPFGNYRAIDTGRFSCTALAELLSHAPPTLQTVDLRLVRLGEAQPSDLGTSVTLPRVQQSLSRRGAPMPNVNMFVPKWEDLAGYCSVFEEHLPDVHAGGLLQLSAMPDESEDESW